MVRERRLKRGSGRVGGFFLTDQPGLSRNAGLADLDLAGFLLFRNLADEIDTEYAVLEARPGHENVIGELEAADEAALGDAAVQEIAVTCILVPGFLAGDREQAFLGFDIDFCLGESVDGEGVFADALNVIRGVALRAVEAGGLIDHAGEAVEADHRAVEGG